MAAPTSPATSRTTVMRIAIVAVVLALAAAAAVFFTPGDEPTAPVDSAGEAPAAEETTAPAGIEQDAEMVAGLIFTSSAGWAAHITGATVTPLLARPVISVSTDISAEEAAVLDEFLVGLDEFLNASARQWTYQMRVLSAEGELVGSFSKTDDRWRLDGPPAPEDAGELRAWLDEVYGTTGEQWLGRIRQLDDPATDPEGYLVIRTDLDASAAGDLSAAQTMIDAVNSSGATFAPGVRVLFGTQDFEWTSLMDGKDPYGP